MTMSEHDLNRRAFLRRGGALSLGGLIAPWAMNLAAMAEAAAAQAGDGYKALVCVFLQGGNDQSNTVIPFDEAGHLLYTQLRGNLAFKLGRADLVDTALTPSTTAGLPPGGQVALAPKLARLKPLFDAGRMAVLLNIGPLVKPVTKDEFKAALLGAQDGKVLPPKLFSHNDQQSVWQSYKPEGSTIGWGGLIGDAGLGDNAQSPLTCVNLASNVVYAAGEHAGQFMVNPQGPDVLLADKASTLFGSADCVAAFRDLTRTDHEAVHRLAKEHSTIMRRAMDVNTGLLSTLKKADADAAAGTSGVALPFPLYPSDGSPSRHPNAGALLGNTLAEQLNTAARMIAVHQQLGVKRQVFFVSLGGFDLHDNLVGQHPALLEKVANALAQFDADLNTLNMRDQVTTFTASDFGRTVSSNGDGSDHGWGSHHFVMGGAVKGGRFYGEWPEITGYETGKHNIGQGRLLPTMAVDHLAAALAGWMGVSSPAALAQLAPNLGNFTAPSPLAALF